MTSKSIGFKVLGVEHPSSLLTRVYKKLQDKTDSIIGLLASPPFDMNHNTYLREGARLFSETMLNFFF